MPREDPPATLRRLSPARGDTRAPPRLARRTRSTPDNIQPQNQRIATPEGANLELALYRLNSAIARPRAGFGSGFESAVRHVEQAVAKFSGQRPSQWESTRKWIVSHGGANSPRSPRGVTVSAAQMKAMQVVPAPGYECLTEEAVGSLLNLFNSVDDGDGELNRTEVIRLLRKVGVITAESTSEQVESIIKDMDTDNSGSVDKVEWVGAVDRSLLENTAAERATLMQGFKDAKTGDFGTSWRVQQNIFWLMLNGVMIITVSTVIAGLVYFKFLLVPLTMAYFFTFVLGPLFDLFHQRPLLCGKTLCLRDEHQVYGSSCCSVTKKGQIWHAGETPSGVQAFGPQQRALAEIFLLGKLPHGLALLVTLLVASGSTFLLAWAIYDQIYALVRTEDGEDSEFVIELYRQLGDLREYLRTKHFVEIEEFDLKNTSVENPTHYNISSTVQNYGNVIASANEFILIMLLCIYMLSTRVMRSVDDKIREQERPHEMSLMEKIENSIRHYVILKTKISFLTGLVVLVALMLLRVKLWLVWGVLTFILNFIPNVGSLIAMLLPLPVALADTTLSPWQKGLAFLIPALVQGYVGNVLEPSLFGKSLNLTDISVLSTLVLWYSLWGLYGAILSVPLLGVLKLLLDAADFPLAKIVLRIIRQDNAVDEGLERTRTGGLENLVLLPGVIEFGEHTAISTSKRGDFLSGIARGTVAAQQNRSDLQVVNAASSKADMWTSQVQYHSRRGGPSNPGDYSRDQEPPQYY